MRFRLSFWVGVEGPPYIEAEGLIGLVVGRARKKRCDTWCWSSTVARTAAAPAQKAKERAFERVSKELAELVVVPMTWRRARETSAWCDFVGERNGVFLRKGEGEGVSLIWEPQAAVVMTLGLFGVSDMA